ncbi:MAG TPA: ROK family protein, partial [Bacillota bacterium]|nr:ROK family protein [Bacillota bacterium]
AETLSRCLGGLPVHVENISNAAAMGEKTFGRGMVCDNLVYLNLSVGISAGIIINQSLFGGAQGYAGEIGSTVISYRFEAEVGDKIRFCNFEQICGVGAILDRIKANVDNQEFTKLGLSKARLTLEETLLSPLIEIPEVRRVVEEAATLIGIKIVELIHLFNTEQVILGGELTAAGDLLLNAVTRTVRENSLTEMTDTVKITISTMREDPALMGVYALVLEKLFQTDEWLQF